MIITWRGSEELDADLLSSFTSVDNFEDAMARLNFWVTRLARNRRNKTAYNTSLINWKLEYVCTSCRSSSFFFKPNRSQYLFLKADEKDKMLVLELMCSFKDLLFIMRQNLLWFGVLLFLLRFQWFINLK